MRNLKKSCKLLGVGPAASLCGTISWEDGWGAAAVVLSLGMAAVVRGTTVYAAAEGAAAGGGTT